MERCKGSRDLLPQDMLKFRYIEQAFMSCCLDWGYKEIRTPTLEYLHLFTSIGTLTPKVLNRVYSFLDWDGWSGERVALRPEGTIPAARLYIDNSLESCPSKLFYIENIFSFEETGKESRERWQCGVELIGCDKPSADIELILLALETLKRLGIEGLELYISHAGLVKAFLQEAGLAPVEQRQVFDQILDGDKEVMRKVISENRQLSDSLSSLFELKSKPTDFPKKLKDFLESVSPDLRLSTENFITIAQFLNAMGYEYKIDMASADGFEYYTGIVFQFYLEGRKIGRGGRYNDLIPLLGGGNIPASGFAFSIDQLIKLLPIKHLDDVRQRVLVQCEIDSAEQCKLSFEVARLLREDGYIAEIDQDYNRANSYQWILMIQNEETSPFVLTNQLSGRIMKADSPTVILNILQEMKANEASSS